MPRKPGKVPSYCRHKASGQAVVRINGSDHYLGPYGSPDSHNEYGRLIAEWRVAQLEASRAGNTASPSGELTNRLSVNALILAYLKFAVNYYSKLGQPTQEYVDMKYALRPLRALYGKTLVRDFGPLALKAVRQYMIDHEDLSRGVINNRINRIRRVFKWAVSEQLAPSGTYEALRAVTGLRRGRTEAREAKPVMPVPQQHVDATLPFMSRQVAAMVELQRLAAMRPGEVVLMRGCDIDMSGAVWLYRPHGHKSEWLERDRVIPLGPKAQQVIKPFLKLSTTAYLFSPKDAEAERNEARRRERKTPMTPSQTKRKSKKQPKRAKRDRYDRDSYRRAITYAIKKANRYRQDVAARDGTSLVEIPHWCPLQLRHSRATEIRRDFGIEAAQVVLGHVRADVTEVHAERNLALAMKIANERG